MTAGIHHTVNWYGPTDFCRLDSVFVSAAASLKRRTGILSSAVLIALVGSVAYGAVFGVWRSPLQAAYSAAKMPLLIVCIALACSVLNTILAQVLGARLTFRHVLVAMFSGFAVTSVVLASVAPVVLFFVLQAPSPETLEGMGAYRVLLPVHIFIIGVAGVIGQIRLFHLLRSLTGSGRLACRILTAWVAACVLVGCELSWVFSPFLARPDLPVPFLNPNAFTHNFFEYLWRCMGGTLP